MKLLHTSDWHLGKQLCKKSREKEMEKFFIFLLETIKKENIDTLIIAGDIFDTATPSNKAIKMYHNFLVDLYKQNKNIDTIIISGNHDSQSSLESSKDLLKLINVEIVTKPRIIYLEDKCYVIAVPFLRESDLLREKSINCDRELEIKNEIEAIYKSLTEKVKDLNKDNKTVIATGHLSMFKNLDDNIYIGTTLNLNKSLFNKNINYTGLGHIHKFGKVDENVYYSGSPICMNFGEKEDKKLIIFDENQNIKTIDIPTFQKIVQLKGKNDDIIKSLKKLKDENVWVEIISEDEKKIDTSLINEIIKDTNIEVLKIQNPELLKTILKDHFIKQELKDIDKTQVFKTLIKDKENKDSLLALYNIVLNKIEEENEDKEDRI